MSYSLSISRGFEDEDPAEITHEGKFPWEAICTVTPEDDDGRSKGMHPLIYPCRFEGGRRSNNAVRNLRMARIDIDQKPVPSEDVLREALAPYQAVAWTTFNSTPAEPRWCALIALENDATEEQYRTIVADLVAQIPGASLSQDDPSRARVAPVNRPGFRRFVTQGKPIPLPDVRKSVPTAPASGPRLIAKAAPDATREKAAKILGTVWPEKGNRHQAQLALAGALLWNGWTEEDALEFLCAVCREAGNEERSKRVQTIDTTVSAIATRRNVTRWGALRKICTNPGIVDSVREMLGMSDSLTIDPEQAERIFASWTAKNQPSGLNPAFTARLEAQNAIYDAQPPIIRVGADLHRIVNEACAALARDRQIYQREGRLVTTVIVGGVPQIHEIPPATLKSELTRVARWKMVTEDGNEKDVIPSQDIVAAVAAVKEWPEEMRSLTKIVETPTLRADGSILQAPGYDPATGFYYSPGKVTFPAVQEAPTKEDAERAFRELYEPFAEFACSEAEKCVGIAAVLTSLAMGALDGENYPAFVFEANVQGAGKGLSCNVVSLLCQGRVTPPQTFPSVDKSELEKILGGIARDGYPFVTFDNISTEFGGDALEGRMTCGGISQSRILGKSETVRLPWRTIVMATGNNVAMTRDMCRRVLRCRIVRLEENPQLKTDWKIDDLEGWVKANRSRLVAAGLTLLRAYFLAGKSASGMTWGSFNAWARLVAGAIKWTSGIDVLATRIQTSEAFDENQATLGALFAAWPEELLGKRFTLKELDVVREELVMQSMGKGKLVERPFLKGIFDEIADGNEKGRSSRVGRWLAKRNEQVIGDFQLLVGTDAKTKTRTYTVKKLGRCK